MCSLNITTKKQNKNDEYYTPYYAWEWINDYIPKDKVIYEPFYSPKSNSKNYLEKLGCKRVIFEDIDFFDDNEIEYDMIISNPPFSKKKEILNRLVNEIDKPFIMIMPVSIVSYQYFKTILQENTKYIQLIIPPKRIHFENDDNKKCCYFDCFYVCYKMNFEKDLIFLPL